MPICIVMRTLLFFAVYLFCTVNLSAQPRIDTLYYTKDGKQAPNMAFSDYYRIAYYPADSLRPNQYRDFYLTGEVQAQGKFLKIDSLDDANTLFDGQCITYFRNGKPASSLNYKNGKLDGEYTVFDENGTKTKSGAYHQGLRMGLFTEFQPDNTYIQVEYLNGVPVGDYYVKGDLEGHLTKYRLSDNLPIWETPTIVERQIEYKDGEPWQFYYKNGVVVASAKSEVRDYGKWHRVELVITNNTMMPLEFDPVINLSASSTDAAGIESSLEVWSSEEYQKKIERTQLWEEVLMGVSEGMATSSAGYSTATTYSTYSFGGYSGVATSTTRIYDSGAAFRAQLLSQQRMADFSNALAVEKEMRKVGYLKRNTINPGESISGYVHVKRVRGEIFRYVVKIEGAEYLFEWNYGKQ